MIPTAIKFDGFSCPQAELDTPLAEVIAVGHARQVVETFLERHESTLASASGGLVELMQRWLQTDASFDDVWDPAFGSIHATLMSAEHDPVGSAALLGLRLSETGVPGDWQVRLPSPTVLRAQGCVFLEATAVTVQSGERGAVADIGSIGSAPATVGLGRYGDGTSIASGAQGSGRPLWTVGTTGFALPVVPAWALPPGASHRLLVADAYRFEVEETAPNPAWLAACAEAMSLLGRVSPTYEEWVRFSVKSLVPLPARAGIFNSGGERFTPGVVCMSDQPYAWPIAEMLVHEATHQYMQILTRVGDLVNGSDLEEHFSPFRGKPRPLFFILVAYHAFANVLLFYRTARAQGLQIEMGFRSEAFENREATLEKQLGVLENTLKTSTGLTELGQALWRPLHGFLH